MKNQSTGTDSLSRRTPLRMRIRGLKEKGYFRYVGRSVLWIIGVYAALIVIVVLIGTYLIDFNTLLSGIVERLTDRLVLLLFLASESFTGMIPVDFFVVWTQKFPHPLPWLALLGLLSYLGAIVSYGIGTWISKGARVRLFTERRLEKYIRFARKWGAAFILIAALFPFTPFSLVVIALALLKYPFRLFLLFGLTRLLRFPIQGIFFFDLLQVDQWIA